MRTPTGKLAFAYQTIAELEARVKELEAENANTMREASSLAMSLWKRHYQEVSPEFGLCDSAAGIISQIDNMTAGISNDLKQMEAENAELRERGAVFYALQKDEDSVLMNLHTERLEIYDTLRAAQSAAKTGYRIVSIRICQDDEGEA